MWSGSGFLAFRLDSNSSRIGSNTSVAISLTIACAVSVLTDECDPENLKPVDISEIIAVAGKAELKLTDLFVGLIEKID